MGNKLGEEETSTSHLKAQKKISGRFQRNGNSEEARVDRKNGAGLMFLQV